MEVVQFGNQPSGEWQERPSVYAVVINEEGRMLVLEVDGEYHLPGGGIDAGENPEQAVIREALEEAGAVIGDLEYIGQANQFFPEDSRNKLGTFYKAALVSQDEQSSDEDSHKPVWLLPQEFISGNSSDFQKWAVRRALVEF